MDAPPAIACSTVEMTPPVPLCVVPEIPKRLSFQTVFEIEEIPLLRFAHQLTGQRELAQDLVQEAFLKLHQVWAEVIHPRAWLYRAVRNLALNHERDHRREVPLEPVTDTASPSSDPHQTLDQREAVESMLSLMAELPDESRLLLHLKYREGLKYEEISQRTGIQIGTVGYKLHHALKYLAESMRRLGIDSTNG